jgi:hypothetical protein
MAFRQLRRGSQLYYLDLVYQGKPYRFLAEYVSFNNLKEQWNIHANGDLLAITYHVQTHEVQQATIFSKTIPEDFLAALKTEFINKS